MASLSRAADGRFTVQFIDSNDKRKSIRLGKIDKRTAEYLAAVVGAAAVADAETPPKRSRTGVRAKARIRQG